MINKNKNTNPSLYVGNNTLLVVNRKEISSRLDRGNVITQESKTTIKISTKKRVATAELDDARRTKDNRPDGYRFNELHTRNIGQQNMDSVDSRDFIGVESSNNNTNFNNSSGKESSEIKNQLSLKSSVIKFKNPNVTLLVFSKLEIFINHIAIHLFQDIVCSANGDIRCNFQDTKLINFIYLMTFSRTCKVNFKAVSCYIECLVGGYRQNSGLFESQFNINDRQDGIPLLLLKGFSDKEHSYFQCILKSYWERLEQGFRYSFKDQIRSKQLEEDFENVTIKNFKRILTVMNLKVTEVLNLEERWLQTKQEDFDARCMHIRHVSMLAKNGFFESRPAIFENIIQYVSKNMGGFMAEYLIEMILNVAKAGLLKGLTEDKINKDYLFLMNFLWKDCENSILEMISELAHLGFFKGKIAIPLRKSIIEIYTNKVTSFIGAYEQKFANREILVRNASETFKHLNAILFSLGSKSEIITQFGKAKLNKITQNRFTNNQWARVKLREILIANIASYEENVFWQFIKDAIVATQQKHDSTYNGVTVDMIIDFCNKDLININNAHNLVSEIKALQVMASCSDKKDQANTLILTLHNKDLLRVIRGQMKQKPLNA